MSIRSDLLSKLSAVSRDLTVHVPTNDQKRAKATFWSTFSSGEVQVPDPIDRSTALKYGGDRRLSGWWDLPGFPDWFTTAAEFTQRIEYLTSLALDGLEDVLKDNMANASAKINAIKLIMELGHKLKSPQEESSFLDKEISRMDRKQLESYLARNIHLLPKTLTLPPEDVKVTEQETT